MTHTTNETNVRCDDDARVGLTAGEIMSRGVFTLTPTDTVGHALECMQRERVRHIPVLEGDNLVGLVSDRDLREYTSPILVQISERDRHKAMLSSPLDEVMRTALVKVPPGAPVAAIVDLLVEYAIGSILVVDEDANTLLGIVSYIDVLRAVRPALGGVTARPARTQTPPPQPPLAQPRGEPRERP